jgi:hypothetical protein
MDFLHHVQRATRKFICRPQEKRPETTMNIGDFAAGEATDEHGMRRMNMLYQSEDFPTPGMAPPTSMYWPACDASRKRGLKAFR